MSDEQPVQRQFLVQRIYTKDLSFEAPNSPTVFKENWQPEINIGLGSEIHDQGAGTVELVLKVNVEAKHNDNTVFMVEVQQAGLFTVQGFSDEEADAVLERLSAGEQFAALALELSTDTGSGAAGGDPGSRCGALW